MRILLQLALIGVGSQLATAPLLAHHAFSAEFDVERPLQLHGTLVKWEMINPHSWFHIDVRNDDGDVTTWMIEGGSPNQLIRLGVTKNTLQIGTELVVVGYQAKDGSNKRASAETSRLLMAKGCFWVGLPRTSQPRSEGLHRHSSSVLSYQ